MNATFYLLSLLPIIILLMVSLKWSVKVGILSGLSVTALLFIVWGNPWQGLPASMIASLVDTINIIFIVFGAILLHENMEQKGLIEDIKSSLQTIHSDPRFQFYFLAFFLTVFFESMAGFGTPGAIVPVLLISMGFPPVQCIATVLLIDGLFAITGAVGTPMKAGLELPLDLIAPQVNAIYLTTSVLMLIGGAAVLLSIQCMNRSLLHGRQRDSWILFLSLALSYVVLMPFLGELSSLGSLLIMGLISYFFFFENRNLSWKPWTPYYFLALPLVLPKFWPHFDTLLSTPVKINNILDTGITASMSPLRSPLLPFLGASLVASFIGRSRSFSMRPVWSKTMNVFVILFPSLVITKLMIHSGTTMPSMVDHIGNMVAGTGIAYPLLSPFVGVLGTFITGSTTVSNIIFGPVQYNAAENLKLSIDTILSLQLMGASLGNAICLFNIIAAAGVAGITNYKEILIKNIAPILVTCLIIATAGLFIPYIL